MLHGTVHIKFLFIYFTHMEEYSLCKIRMYSCITSIMWHRAFPPSELDCHVNITDGEKEVDPWIYSCLSWHGVHATCNM